MRTKLLAPGLVVLGMLALIWWRFPDFFVHANSWVIEPWGDGFKSIHAYLYHIQYDPTLTHFSGMNYPYGEHAVPGDTQPLLSNGIKIGKSWGLDLTGYALGIFNGALLLGLVVCAVVLFLLFRQLHLPSWYAAPAAVALTFMAPQLDRMETHYGLGHPELLPLVFYLLLRYHRSPGWGWSAGLGLVVWAYSLLHFYYFAILAFTIGGFMGLRWLLARDWRATGWYVWHGSLQLLAPLVFFYFWLYYLDPVTDRTPSPWGFYVFRAWPSGIFTSMAEPHWQWFDEHVYDLAPLDMEAHAYVGLLAGGYVLVVALRWLLGLGRRWPVAAMDSPASDTRYLNLLFVTALFILLFALGLPFTLPGGERLLEWAGPIRQFRSIGRFAWVWYYALNICALYELYRWAAGRAAWRWVVAGLAMALLAYESYHFCRFQDLRLDPIAEWAPGQRYTDIDTVDWTQYQAIIPIPYYNIGSDNYWWQLEGYTGQQSQTLSIQTGLPLTAAMLTRTSRSQTMKQLQLVTEPYRVPALLDDLPSQKPFLLLWDDERAVKYPGRFEHLRAGLSPVWVRPPLYLYALPLPLFGQRVMERVHSVQGAWHSGQLKEPQPGWRTTDSSAHWIYLDFDDRPSQRPYRGSGGYEALLTNKNIVLDTLWTQPSGSEALVLNVWMWLDADRHARSEVIVQQLDPQTGQELARHQQQAREWVQAFDNHGWVLLECTLTPAQPQVRLRLTLTNPELRGQHAYLDELLVRPAGVDIYRRVGAEWWYNGRWWGE